MVGLVVSGVGIPVLSLAYSFPATSVMLGVLGSVFGICSPTWVGICLAREFSESFSSSSGGSWCLIVTFGRTA